MCGSLKLENEMYRIKINGVIPKDNIEGLNDSFNKSEYHWTGWARIDGSRDKSKTFAEQWPKEKNRIVTIKEVSEFTEYNRHLNTEVVFPAKGKQIAAIVDRTGQLKIITRASKNDERKIHDRMPVTISDKMGRNGFIGYIKGKLNIEYE